MSISGVFRMCRVSVSVSVGVCVCVSRVSVGRKSSSGVEGQNSGSRCVGRSSPEAEAYLLTNDYMLNFCEINVIKKLRSVKADHRTKPHTP